MTELYFIRHGATSGNRARRYVGRTDEPLCDTGRREMEALRAELPAMERIYVSPMRRAKESARLLFPDRAHVVIPDFREIDFGRFEGKTAAELSGDPAYRAWVDAGCTGDIPEGESVAAFRARCVAAFWDVMGQVPASSRCAFVVHGGCIMSILAACAVPGRGYFDYQIPTGGCIRCTYDPGEALLRGPKAEI